VRLHQSKRHFSAFRWEATLRRLEQVECTDIGGRGNGNLRTRFGQTFTKENARIAVIEAPVDMAGDNRDKRFCAKHPRRTNNDFHRHSRAF